MSGDEGARAEQLSALEELWRELAGWNGLNPAREMRERHMLQESSFRERFPVFLDAEHVDAVFTLSTRVKCEYRCAYNAVSILQAWFNRAAATNPQRMLSVLQRSALIMAPVQTAATSKDSRSSTRKRERWPLAYVVALRLAVKCHEISQKGSKCLRELHMDYSKDNLAAAEVVMLEALDHEYAMPTPFESLEIWFHVAESTCFALDQNSDSTTSSNTSAAGDSGGIQAVRQGASFTNIFRRVSVRLLDLCYTDPERFFAKNDFDSITAACLVAAWLLLNQHNYAQRLNFLVAPRFPLLTVICSFAPYNEAAMLHLAHQIADNFVAG